MGEAIIADRGGGASDPIYEFVREVITENKVFTMPVCENQSITVKCFGGGGGNFTRTAGTGSWRAYDTLCGGGGNFNKKTLTINPGTQITINIGARGQDVSSSSQASANAGGTTFFGSYIAATGGEGGSYRKGGDGGSGGAPMGKGFWFGSASGGSTQIPGGNYGGYGGTMTYALNDRDSTNKNAANGGDGTDTRLMNDIESEFKGYANAGLTNHGYYISSGNYYWVWIGGGGGGWGCKGGTSMCIYNGYGDGSPGVAYGGGGGYGCDGGNGLWSSQYNASSYITSTFIGTNGVAGGYGATGRACSGQAGICILEYMIKR